MVAGVTIEITTLVQVALSLVAAIVMAFGSTPVVKSFAERVGAIDNPDRDDRRMHTKPIPRQGGLAIFLGFIISVVLFAKLTQQVQSILIGTVIVVITGAIDDIVDLKAWIKAIAQLSAALIAVLWGGVVIERFSNPFGFLGWGGAYIELGVLSVPLSVIWIVAITNSVNFIDGLDGLAVGVSGIASGTMLVTALIVADSNTAIVMAALCGACIGFMPYNMNPAKIFQGDTGALLLGYVLSTMSVLGVFKSYAIVSFAAPFLMLALPIADEVFAIVRRLAKGQKPWVGDRGHIHHRLINLGLTQKQAVAVCYCASTVLGLLAVVMATNGGVKGFLFGLVFVVAGIIAYFIFKNTTLQRESAASVATQAAEAPAGTAEESKTDDEAEK